MRIKYFASKLLIINLAVVATPVVWAALAWPEWTSAGSLPPPDQAAVQSVPVEPTATPTPEPVVIRNVIIVQRYVEVTSGEGAPAQSAQSAAPTAPAKAPASAPTQAPTAATNPGADAATKPKAAQDPAASGGAASGGGSGGSGGATGSSGGGSTTSGGASGGTTGSSGGGGSTTSSGGGSTSSGKTKGS